MAEQRFSAEIVVACPPGAVFDWVADYRHVAEVLEGVSRWEPLQGEARGRGARFDVAMSALGLPLESVLVLDQWEEPRRIGWRSESGLIEQSGRWEFEPSGDGTRVSLSIGYVPPFGVVGRLVAGEVDALVRARLQRALEKMKRVLERDSDPPA
jgi:ribosome-associated toxin RatA of RatAB toxin-antitoxin module